MAQVTNRRLTAKEEESIEFHGRRNIQKVGENSIPNGNIVQCRIKTSVYINVEKLTSLKLSVRTTW